MLLLILWCNSGQHKNACGQWFHSRAPFFSRLVIKKDYAEAKDRQNVSFKSWLQFFAVTESQIWVTVGYFFFSQS